MSVSVRREHILHSIFTFGVWMKAVDGGLEIAGGLILLVISPATLNRIVATLTQHELVEDPHDLIATIARHTAAVRDSVSELVRVPVS